MPPALSTLVDELLEKDPSQRPVDAKAVRSRIDLIAKTPLDEDLTVPLRLPDDVTTTREYTREYVAPTPPPPRPAIELLRTSQAVAMRWASSIASRWRDQDRRRKTQVVGVALAVALVFGIVVSQLGGTPTTPSPPAISTPTTVPSSAPVPAPLARSLNNLLRSVGS